MSTPGTCQCGCGAPVEEGAAFTDAHDPTPVIEPFPPLYDLDRIGDFMADLESDMRDAMLYAARWVGEHANCPRNGSGGCTYDRLCGPCQAAMWRDFTRSRKGE